jgi:hypothetical protein
MRIISFIILCSLCYCVQAQQNKAMEHIGWRGNIQLHTVCNKHQSCTFILNRDSAKAFLLSGNEKIVELFTVPKHIDEHFLGSFIKNEHIYLFMDNGKIPGIRCWLYSIADKTITENIVPFAINDEKIINRLSSDNYFFYFTINKKTSQFVIYKFNSESYCDTLSYTVDPEMWADITTKSGALFSKPEINIEKADREGECDIDIAQNHNKIYVRNDTLYLLMNNQKAVTTVYTFDLINNKMGYRFILHEHDDENILPSVYNSFLLRNKLYYASANGNALFLQIVDFYSGDILKEFKASSKDEITFKNTAITQEGRFNSNRELGKTKQLLRKMTSGNIVITATPDDRNNNVQLLVGSYKQISSGGGGGGMWMAGAGVTGAPSMTFMPTGGFGRDIWIKSSRFKMLINPETNEHIEGDILPSINDRIEDYTRGIRIPSEGENLFVVNGSYYHAFYDKQKRDFIITLF